MSARRCRLHGLAFAAMTAMSVAACGTGTAPPRDYVLGAPVAESRQAVSQVGLPVVEIRPVRLPEYLDTTDLLTRRAGGQIEPSQTARWGERLSIGVARSLASSLATRLPSAAVTTMSAEQPSWQVLVDLDSFEQRQDGNCVLAGRWSVRDGRRRTIEVERVSLLVPVDGTNDEHVVAAMTHAVDEFAARIAATLQQRLPR
jgi:uncharacterized lipoprotein YmbA